VVSLLQQAQVDGDDWFFALVEHSSDLIVVVDQAGVVIYANPVASLMYGVPLEEAIGASAFRFIHPEDLDRLMARMTSLLEQPGASHTDTMRFVSDTGEVWVLEIVATNCLHVPAISGIVVNGRDVTERNDYLSKLQASLDAITIAVANMVEIRDPYTAGHQRQVAHIAGAIARELALPEDDIKGIEVASTIHDIGKIAVPSEILTRPGRLTRAEFEIIKSHSQAGHDIVADVPFPWPVAEMILQHHERLDGSGYPRGLIGNAILMGSRILAVADVVSAMSEHRPYRVAPGLAAALTEVEANCGTLYEPAVVDACLSLFREGHLQLNPDAD